MFLGIRGVEAVQGKCRRTDTGFFHRLKWRAKDTIVSAYVHVKCKVSRGEEEVVEGQLTIATQLLRNTTMGATG